MPGLRTLLETVTETLERATWLDPIGDAGQKVTGLLKPGAVMDLLSGTPIGHPAHPVLVTVPIGAVASATVLDATGSDPDSARRLIGLGLLSSLPAAATGLADWGTLHTAERRVGVAHALANTVGLGLLGASWWARRSGGGKTLSLAGFSVLGVSGWLGGHLAYAQGVGVDTTAFQQVPTDWTDAAGAEVLVDGEPHAVTVGDLPVLLLRRGDSVTAIGDRCTHRGAPLSSGELVDGCIQCPWHGSRFDVETGAVERGPATRPQVQLQTRIVDGRVQVRRDEARSLRLNSAV